MERDYIISDQASASIVGLANATRNALRDQQLERQDKAFLFASQQIDNIREFISKPANILGSERTKHGEVAEQLEVGIRNAKQAMAWSAESNEDFLATFEGVGRTAPEDYLINGTPVQSKFINGARNTLAHISNHLDKYEGFAEKGFYHVPNSQFSEFEKIMNGEDVPGLSLKKQESIRRALESLENKTGKSYSELIKPAIHDYDEVQLGVADKTIDSHEKELKRLDDDKRSEINTEHAPSLSEGVKVAGKAAAFAGVVSLGAGIYKKHKEGKSLLRGDLTKEDWQELGVITGKGAALGGVTAGAIYALTNYVDMPAPFAGAVASTFRGVSELSAQLSSGAINFDEFCELGMALCTESAAAAITSVLGQTIIPVPVLGAAIGSMAGKILISSAKSWGSQIEKKLNSDMALFYEKLSATEKSALDRINAKLDMLHNITTQAFDPKRNESLMLLSIQLAEAYGVKDKLIIRSHSDLDDFMLN